MLRGKDAFLAEVQKGGFVALTGVEPRRPIRLLEGATYSIASDNSITFVLSNGVVVPPLSRNGYEAVRSTLPPEQRYVLDDKFFLAFAAQSRHSSDCGGLGPRAV